MRVWEMESHAHTRPEALQAALRFVHRYSVRESHAHTRPEALQGLHGTCPSVQFPHALFPRPRQTGQFFMLRLPRTRPVPQQPPHETRADGEAKRLAPSEART